MKIFLNTRGEFLKFYKVDTATASKWAYEWVADINAATVAGVLPIKPSLWKNGIPPMVAVALTAQQSVRVEIVDQFRDMKD